MTGRRSRLTLALLMAVPALAACATIFALEARPLLLIAAAVVTWQLTWLFLLARASEDDTQKISLRWGATTLGLALALGLVEGSVLAGLLDGRRLFGVLPPAKPWLDKSSQLDPELLHRHGPDLTVNVERRTPDLVGWLGCPPADVPFTPFVYRSDADGFRNDASEGATGVACVGDSFVEAHYLPAEETLPAQLSRLLGQKVANYGQVWYGPQQEAAVLSRFALARGARTIVWCFFEGNDLWDALRYERVTRKPWEETLREWRGTWRQRSVIRSFLIRLRRSRLPEPEPASRFAGEWQRPGRAPLTIYFAYPARELNAEDERALSLVDNAYEAAARDAAAAGARVLVCFIPTTYRVYGPLCVFPKDSLCREWRLSALPEKLRAVATARGFEFLDLTGPLAEAARQGEMVFYPDDSHWAPRGIEVAAAAITEVLR